MCPPLQWVKTHAHSCLDRPNQLRFVYTHFKSCDQSLDKTPFDFSNIYGAMQSCAMNAKSMVT